MGVPALATLQIPPARDWTGLQDGHHSPLDRSGRKAVTFLGLANHNEDRLCVAWSKLNDAPHRQ